MSAKSSKSPIPGIFTLFGMGIGPNLAETFFTHPWSGGIGMVCGAVIGFLLGKLFNYSSNKNN